MASWTGVSTAGFAWVVTGALIGITVVVASRSTALGYSSSFLVLLHLEQSLLPDSSGTRFPSM